MNHIHFIPAGDENTASSRLRVYSLAESLEARGVAVSIGAGIPDAAAVVAVQKRVTPDILAQVAQAKARGALVVYDVDDSGNALWYWSPPRLCKEMLGLAHVVTVDTQARAEWLHRAFRGLRVFVCPNAIDYAPTQSAGAEPVEHSPLRVFWFGSVGTLVMFRRHAEALAALPDVRVVVCSGITSLTDEIRDQLRVEIVPWTRQGFVGALQGCDISCLMHDGTADDRRKSNHKMITSICWGVPAIVSDTPEYRRTAIEAGVQDAVFGNAEELLQVVERFRCAAARRRYLASAQPHVWQSYAPEHIADRFVGVIAEAEELISESSTRGGTAKGRLAKFVAYLQWRWHLEDDHHALIWNWMKGITRIGLKV